MSGNEHEIFTDRRVRRTRRALVDAYNGLVLSQRFGDIRVADIVKAADVGRSTFYEHYSGRDAIHRDALSGPFGLFADALTGRSDAQALIRLLDHFWENRARARAILTGDQRAQAARLLAELIGERLEDRGMPGDVPARVIAVQLAEAQLGVVRAWIMGEVTAPAAALAEIMAASSEAMLASLETADQT